MEWLLHFYITEWLGDIELELGQSWAGPVGGKHLFEKQKYSRDVGLV